LYAAVEHANLGIPAFAVRLDFMTTLRDGNVVAAFRR
jgi:hypothetical protein